MPDVSLFGPVTFPIAIPIAILVTRPVAVFIPVLCGLWFLFWAMPEVPPPHDATVSSGRMMIRSNCWKGRIPHPSPLLKTALYHPH